MTTEQSNHVNFGSFDTAQANQALSNAANNFRKSIQEATSHLGSATEQFTAMSAALARSVEDVRTAAAKVHEDREATEAIQARFERDYGNLLSLIVDLQERIGALAVLGRPIATPALVSSAVADRVVERIERRPEDGQNGQQPEAQNGKQPEEGSGEWSDGQEPANKDPKKWLGWKGWQG
jgi:hypothetical protein